jgi:RHS repeat-associated protein
MPSRRSRLSEHAKHTAVLAATVVAVLAVGSTQATVPAGASPVHPPRPMVGTAVPVHTWTPSGAATPAALTQYRPPVAALPAPAQYVVALAGPKPAIVPSNSRTAASARPTWGKVGTTGIEIAVSGAARTTSTRPQNLGVQVLSRTTALGYGDSGFALQLVRTDGVKAGSRVALRIPTRLLAGAFGANFASRVHWVQRPAASPIAATVPLAATPDPGTQSLTLAPEVSVQPMVVAAVAGPTAANGTGSFSATPLAPSASWPVSTQAGDFSWNYPLRLPPAAAGPAPSLALSYNSGRVDGETGSTNNQPSGVGEGWNLAGAGFIERSYVPCSTDGVSASGDECWKTDNATMSFAGHTGLLVKDSASGTWRMQADDGTRVEKLTGASNGGHNGEYWKLTTTDGTQSFFGRAANSAWSVPVFGNNTGEPCHAATFATSACTQTWRWNLDYVVDGNGNTESFTYTPEPNKYRRNNTTVVSYTQGGHLTKIDYGYRAGATGQAPERVLFDLANRCISTTNCDAAHRANWPDVPWDQHCGGTACTGLISPTFWTTKKIVKIHPQLLSGTTYHDVDAWSLTHSFPATGDGTSPALWLSTITHTGYSGAAAIALPRTAFHGVQTQNRVWAVDGLAPLDKYRISSLSTEAGATVTVTYAPKQCTPTNEPVPQTNTMRCFPQWWTPRTSPPQAAQLDWFHKYVVTEVAADPRTGGTGDTALDSTFYDYTGNPGWRYDTSPLVPAAKRTWSVYAGYSTVRVRHGDENIASQQETTSYAFFRGLDGDRATAAGGTKTMNTPASDGSSVPDSLWLAGRVREQTTSNGYGGARVANTITTAWASPVRADDGTNTARIVADADVVTQTALAAGGNRTTETKTSFDTDGRVTAASDLGDTSTSTDDRCTRTSYSTNTSAWILNAPADVEVYAAACSAAPSYPSDAISHTHTYYDGSATLGAPPSTGDATRTDIAASYTGSTPNWQTTTTSTYDGLGRPTAVTDHRTGTDRTTTTTYTPATGPVTQSVITNPLGWTTTTSFDPARGAATAVVDPNGHRTDTTYDALGRVTQVWRPERLKSANPTSPSMSYAYTVSATAPSSVATTTVGVVAGTTTSYALYDGLLRPRQTQVPSEGGGRTLTDRFYDNAGRVSDTNDGYFATGDPSARLLIPDVSVPSSTTIKYDGAGRKAVDISLGNNVEQWRTSYGYGGDNTSVTPPAGATPTRTYTDARGHTVKLLQYHGRVPSGAADTTTYGYDPRGAMTAMTDPAGNAWSWSFDTLGRQVSAHDPGTGTSSTSYDTAGRLAATTDNAGNVLAYSYDTLDRKTAEYADSTSGTLLASWTYDTLAKGQITSSARHSGADTYTTAVTGYDAADMPTGHTITIPASAGALAGSYTTSLTYGVGKALTRQVDPAAGGLPSETLRYGIDSLGNVDDLFSASGDYLAGVFYTHLGQIALTLRAESGAEIYDTYTWDPASGRLAEEMTQRVVSSGAVVSDDEYTYDHAGNMTTDTNTVPSAGTDTQCFNYDYLQRLTAAWTPASNSCSAAPTSAPLGGPAPYWNSYGYDLVGNRTTSTEHATTGGADTTDTYTYPSAGFLTGGTGGPNAVTSISHTTSGATTTDHYNYNANGATTTRPGQNLTYDTENHLATITAGASTQNRIYDTEGNLLLQTGDQGATLYLGDTELHLAPGDSTPTGVRTYTAAGLVLAERATTAGVAGSHLVFLDPNPQSTSTATVDTTDAQTVARRYFDPFGDPRGTSATWPSNHGFLNKPTDTLTGITHLGARDYDPTTGRFLTVDPILDTASPQQANGYSYADNNPFLRSDPG